MKKVIIFEGPDGAGKSTISKALSERIKCPIYYTDKSKSRNPTSKYWVENLVYGETKLLEVFESLYKTGLDVPVIRDRSFYSEFVYAEVFGRTTSIKTIFDLDAGYATSSYFSTLVVYCLKDSYEVGEDFDSVKENIEAIDEVYRTLPRIFTAKSLVLNTSDQDLPKQLELIMRELN